MIQQITDAVRTVVMLILFLAACAGLWWVLGATFGIGYLGFKFVTG